MSKQGMRQHGWDIREFADGALLVSLPHPDWGGEYDIKVTTEAAAKTVLWSIRNERGPGYFEVNYVDNVVWEIENARTPPAADAWRLALEGMAERIKEPWGGGEDVLTVKQYEAAAQEARDIIGHFGVDNTMAAASRETGDIDKPPVGVRQQAMRVAYALCAIERTRKTTKQALAEAGSLVGGGVLGSLFGAVEETQGEDPKQAFVTDDMRKPSTREISYPVVFQDSENVLMVRFGAMIKACLPSNTGAIEDAARWIEGHCPYNWRAAWRKHAHTLANGDEGTITEREAWHRVEALLREPKQSLVTDEHIESIVREPVGKVPLPEIKATGYGGSFLQAMWTDETRPDRYSKNSTDPDAIAQTIAAFTPAQWRETWAQHAMDMASRTEGVVCQAWAKLAIELEKRRVGYTDVPRDDTKRPYEPPTIDTMEAGAQSQKLRERAMWTAPGDDVKRLELRETPDDAQRLEDNRALIKSLPDGPHKLPWEE